MADKRDERDYTLAELLEQAKNDPSWEPDEARREVVVRQMQTSILNA